MDHELIIMSEKGLIQIPKSIRNMLFAHAFTIKVQDADIILTPVAEVEGALSSFATQDLKKTEWKLGSINIMCISVKAKQHYIVASSDLVSYLMSLKLDAAPAVLLIFRLAFTGKCFAVI